MQGRGEGQISAEFLLVTNLRGYNGWDDHGWSFSPINPYEHSLFWGVIRLHVGYGGIRSYLINPRSTLI